ncbi:MAG: FAD-dependent oxidoreductase [Ruminococcus sp.]|nr:FAD-dependent oxidoreductase [Ruminococcus sp.]
MSTIWEDVTFEKRESLQGLEVADCTVIGAGLAGVLIARELQSRGFSVVVLEADRVCSGATARTTAKITSQHGLIYNRISRQIGKTQARLYYESNQKAIDRYEEIIKAYGIDCDFKRLPSYVYSRSNVYNLLQETLSATNAGAKCRYTKDTSLPFGIRGALRFEDQAQFHPLKFAKALAKNLKIYEKTPVTRIEDGKVLTQSGEVRTQYIVCATHYPIINIPGFYFLRQHQERSYALALSSQTKLDGMYLGIDDGHSLRSFDGGIILGGEKHRTGKNTKGGCLCRLKDFASENFEGAEILGSWSNQDCITHDGLPFIGRYSRFSPRFFVATGFNKWGMSLSMVASELIADMICGRKNEYEKLYTPARMNIRAGAGGFLLDAGSSAYHLISGLVSKKERKCPHLGCRLQKNPDENTWECPCHGSGFDKTGQVKFSPAKKNIEKKQG